MAIVICSNCGVEFNKPPCHIRRVKKSYCSIGCHNTDQSNSIAKVCWSCGSEFNVRPCEFQRVGTCSKRECRRKTRWGANNPNWRGGVTVGRKKDMTSKEYRSWRLGVLSRDNFVCQLCGKSGGTAHHIKSYAEHPKLDMTLKTGRPFAYPAITKLKENGKET